MRVILKEDVHNLGHANDEVNVKNGYARNFLIPRKKAVLATESEKKILAETLKQRAHKLQKIKEDAIALGEKLKGLKVVIKTKCSESGKIYGSVNSVQLASALSNMGYTVERKLIEVGDNVKEVGAYTATIKLHKEVVIELPYEVVAE